VDGSLIQFYGILSFGAREKLPRSAHEK
jgi:hypothetical protein